MVKKLEDQILVIEANTYLKTGADAALSNYPTLKSTLTDMETRIKAHS